MARSRAPLIVFGDSRTFLSTTLVAAVLDAARARGLLAVVCEAARHPPPPRVRAGGSYVLASAGRRLFDPAHPIVLGRPMWTGLEGLARRARVPLTVPPGRDVNDPSFVAGLRDRFTPALALAVGCAQVFRRPLLVRAFGTVSVKLDGIAYDVTRFHRLAGGEHGPRGLVFTTSDGVAATPDRIRHLPVPLARVFKGLAGSGAT